LGGDVYVWHNTLYLLLLCIAVINLLDNDAQSIISFKNRLCCLLIDLLLFCLAGYDPEGKKLMKQLGVDEQLTNLTSIPPAKSALDLWQVL
jgi:hypothetical protein